ncbi:MAG: family 10 glycosylhydrolase, partial [Lachnospiraceae bacterium]|nr:family 10 glycosylhydrolase [Lachnospiraceae bacterium]
MVLRFKKLICLICALALVSGFVGEMSGQAPVRAYAAEDDASADTEREFRAVWIAYYDFGVSHYSNAADFTTYVNEMFDNAVALGMNAVVVHVRPFSDAMYKSSYFPWSSYASGKQGVDPGYDPLAIMVEEAHARDLEIHAWLNPYRITAKYTLTEEEKNATPLMQKTLLAKRLLSKKNPARKWLSNKKTSDDRRVIAYQAQLYYNPAIAEVRKLIVNGVKEIVENYDVDGIHFDDYFYPAFTKET